MSRDTIIAYIGAAAATAASAYDCFDSVEHRENTKIWFHEQHTIDIHTFTERH